jgi:hypothetical protein
VSKGWVSKLVARYRAEGEAAFEPRSRRPRTSPTAIDADTVELIVRLRKDLADQGLDAGPDMIAWPLAHHHQRVVSRATISRYLTRHGLVVPEPKKRPRSSYIRFEAELPNETWQGRLHPLPPHRRQRRGDPVLAGRPLPLRPAGHLSGRSPSPSRGPATSARPGNPCMRPRPPVASSEGSVTS